MQGPRGEGVPAVEGPWRRGLTGGGRVYVCVRKLEGGGAGGRGGAENAGVCSCCPTTSWDVCEAEVTIKICIKICVKICNVVL